MTAPSPHPNAPVLSADAHPSTLEVKHGETLVVPGIGPKPPQIAQIHYVKPSRGCGPATSVVGSAANASPRIWNLTRSHQIHQLSTLVFEVCACKLCASVVNRHQMFLNMVSNRSIEHTCLDCDLWCLLLPSDVFWCLSCGVFWCLAMFGVVDLLGCSRNAKARTTTPMAMVAITVVRSRWGPIFQGPNTPSRQELAEASRPDSPSIAVAYFISIQSTHGPFAFPAINRYKLFFIPTGQPPTGVFKSLWPSQCHHRFWLPIA